MLRGGRDGGFGFCDGFPTECIYMYVHVCMCKRACMYVCMYVHANACVYCVQVCTYMYLHNITHMQYSVSPQ